MIRPPLSGYRILETVRSGKSAARRPMTSPMVSASPDTPVVPAFLQAPSSASPGLPRSTPVSRAADPSARVEHQAVLPDLDLVAVAQQRLLDQVAVDIGAVEAADVAHQEALRGARELGVPARDGHVVQEDVAVGAAAHPGHVSVQQEP